MKLENVRAELEEDLSWRVDELRLLKNQLGAAQKVGEADRLRRALVVMLYAHFEGFCKTALSIYVSALNSQSIPCRDAVFNLTASAQCELFAALANSQVKHPFFKKKAPDDSGLHQLYRQVEFVSGIDVVGSAVVKLNAIRIVDPESNLNPLVISKILYRLGFPEDQFKSHSGAINKLLNRRNRISHGESRETISMDDFLELEQSVRNIMDDILRLIFAWLREKRYLRVVATN